MPRIIKPVARSEFTSSTITIDSSGRVISAASGSAGGGSQVPVILASGPSSGTLEIGNTLSNNASFISAYLYAAGAGGGGGSRQGGRPGGTGGAGGFGYYGAPISAPFSQPFSIGGGGSGGVGGNFGGNGSPGSSGGATSIANIGTVNSGNGGGGGTQNQNQQGSAGSAPGTTTTIGSRDLFGATNFGVGGNGGTGTVAPNPDPIPGNTGAAGLALIYQNTGA